MKKFIIPLLTVVMVASIIFAGCVPIPEAPAPPIETPPEAPPEAPEAPPITPTLPEAPPPTALPKPGEWTASTGASEFEFTSFTVSPDSTSITLVTYDLKEFTCGPTTVSGKASLEKSPPWTITGGQFTIDWEEYLQYGPNWDIIIQGRFDETGTQASGTWEISAEGIICQEGTWEASAP